jgi:hypothetical protein
MIICCPACGFRGRVPEGKDGRDKKRVICPSCGHRFSVGLVVVPSGDQPTAGGADTAPPYRDGKKNKRRPFLWGCLIAAAALSIGIAIFFLINGISRQVQESKESDILKKLGEKYPGYLLLNSIAIDPGSMTELQITSYEGGLVGKGCVGMGTVVNIEKTMGSTVLDFFGLTAPGTIITLAFKGYDIELLLDESYSDEFLTYGVGDTVLFAGTIKKAVIDRRTRVALVDVIIEGHRKGESGSRPPEIKKSLTKRLIELLLQ